ncbi:alpha/beta hydrolase [Vallicoccus soli]|uniref:Alpha/beta hydrolase n=1 Tax=Vallicoccus soli TaxID=2339232 RepID=A0A3A3Z8D3_9ACTN|nr:alpha/beta hydrolase [Vallicoccus soli]RJK97107.1 alpha/beta hydrolase [Vallicoccus soli]
MLHPQSAALAAAADGPGPGDEGFDLAAARRAMSGDAPPPVPGDAVALVADVDADGVRCRLYRPREGAPVLVHVHGGGWVVGDLESHDAVCRSLAARSGCAVLAVDYRLAPEHPWPAALEDVEAAVAWLRREGRAHGVDPGRLALTGDSAGGGLVAALALRARDAGGPTYALQVLVYPVLDARRGGASYAQEGNGALRPAEMAWYWDAYAPPGVDRARPDVSPSAAADLAGLPPALVLSAEHDVLRDEAEDYAARLALAGVPVAATRWLGTAHGFFRRPATMDAASAAVDQVAAAVRRALGA